MLRLFLVQLGSYSPALDRHHKLQQLVWWCGPVARQCQAFIHVCGGESISPGCQHRTPSLPRQRLHPLQGCERFVCLCVHMTEILGEKDGAPDSTFTLTDPVLKRCRDFWFGVVLPVQSASITTRIVCVEISQSNNNNNNRMTYFS